MRCLLFVLAIFVATLLGSVAAISQEAPVEAKVDVPVESPSKLTTQPVPESAIPVHLDAKKKSAAPENPWVRMLLAVGILGLISIATLLYLRRVSVKDKTSVKAPDIKVLTQHHLGPKKSLAIIRVAGESILIGITDSSISLIKELSLLDEEIPADVPRSFKKSFRAANRDFQSQEAQNEATEMSPANEPYDEFSISGIRDVVSSKLKKLRPIQ